MFCGIGLTATNINFGRNDKRAIQKQLFQYLFCVHNDVCLFHDVVVVVQNVEELQVPLEILPAQRVMRSFTLAVFLSLSSVVTVG